MNEYEERPSRPRLPARIAEKADSFVGLTLRAAIASIPIIGNSASLLVEARLSKLQADRLDILFARLAELEARVGGENQAAPPSEMLIEAVATAAKTADQERARAFANILYLEGAGEDHGEVLRRFLIEVLATLSRYEIALLLNYAPEAPDGGSSDFAQRLLSLHARNPEVDHIRQFALDRLATFRLINVKGKQVDLTPIGRQLLSAI